MSHPNLRAALAAAMAEVEGLVFKAGANKAQGYRYVGHEDVIHHVRKALVNHGVVIVPTDLRFVGEMPKWTTRSGEQSAWLWEQTFEIVHAGSDEVRVAKVQATTNCNDKASFVASTAADRTLLMRLMRLAGTSEENPEHDSHDEGGQQGSSQQQRQQPAQGKQGGQSTAVLATLNRELAAQGDFEALAAFHNHAVAEMRAARASEAEERAFWAAWGKRCQALKFDPREVAAVARKKAA